MRGEYGEPPAPIDSDLQKKILGDEQPFTGRFADTLAPEFEPAKASLGAIARCEEDVLSYIAFPKIAEKFFQYRQKQEENQCSYTIMKIEE